MSQESEEQCKQKQAGERHPQGPALLLLISLESDPELLEGLGWAFLPPTPILSPFHQPMSAPDPANTPQGPFLFTWGPGTLALPTEPSFSEPLSPTPSISSLKSLWRPRGLFFYF